MLTATQYRRWKDFALRMAQVVCPKSKRPSADWVRDHVADFFGRMLEDSKDEPSREARMVCDWDSSDAYEEPAFLGCTSYAPLVCDLISEWSADINPFYYEADDSDEAYEQYEEQWIGPIRCCVRAGLDIAASPSAGVVGFTAGDVRTMYPEGVPDWVQNGLWYEGWPGPHKPGTGKPFADIRDDERLLL